MEVKSRVLAREREQRLQTARSERVGDGSQFDRFGPGADHQPDVVGVQPSP
jgi:hypothetical protein